MSVSAQEVLNRVFPFPAAVIRGGTQAELRALALEREVLDEEAIQKYDPYFWTAEISNNRLDSHFTRMAVSSLKNYAADANEGVSFLYNHDTEQLIGSSMSGRFVGGQGDGVARVVADFYTIRGFQLGTVSSDQIILGIDSKILKYVSIGFYGGQWICSICGRDMWSDWDCWHIPSISYEIEGDAKVREEVCTADVEDAHLAETSGVYKGSTPNAVITKAQQEAERGRIKAETRTLIEQRFRIHLPGKVVTVPGHTNEESARMSTNRESAAGAQTDQTSTQPGDTNPAPGTAAEGAEPPPAPTPPPPAPPPLATEGTTTGGADEGAAIDVDERSLQPAAATLFSSILTRAGVPAAGTLTARVGVLIERARDGVAYRESLINEALQEGVRAYGTSFNQEAYRRTLEGLSVEGMRLMRDDWARIAKATFPGGRQTAETTGAEGGAGQSAPALSDSAYGGV